MNTASDFIRHLLRRKKLRLKKDDIVTQKYQINSVVNLKTSKVDIEKENEKYIIKGAKVDIPQKSPIEIIKTRNLINVTKDEESIVKARVEEKVIQKLEEAINNNKKFEIKIEDINEKNIRTELSTLIKKDKEETKKIEEELGQINEKATPFNTLEDVKKLEQRINEIKTRLSAIQKHYKIISEYYEFKGYNELQNTILINSIEDYTFYQNSTNIDKLVNECKQECKKLDTIIEATDKCIKTDKKVLEVRKYTEKRDEEYTRSKEEIKLIDATYEKIENNIKYQDEFLVKLENDIENIEGKLNDKNTFALTTSLLDNLFKMTMNAYLMPFFPSLSIIIQAILIEKSIKGIRSFLNPEIKRDFITRKFIGKYIKIIYDNKAALEATENLLTSNIEEIKNLRQDYIEKFGPYSDYLDGYKENLKKMENALDKLTKKNIKVKEMKEELKKKKEKILELK